MDRRRSAGIVVVFVFENREVQNGAGREKFGFFKFYMHPVRDNFAFDVIKLVGLLVIAVAKEDSGGGFGGQLVAAVWLAHEKIAFTAEDLGF